MIGLFGKAFSAVMAMLFLIGLLMLTFGAGIVNAEGSWVWVRDTVTGAYGEAVVGTGVAIYIARGSSFYRYMPADNSLVRLASPPKPDGKAFTTGTALAWDFGDHIYALYGAASGDSRRYFYRYDISQNLWKRLADTPFDQGEGDAMTYVERTGVYATVGGERRPTYLLFYDPRTNSWEPQIPAPMLGMGDGASMVWTGSDCLYVLRGEYLEEAPLYDFWQYNITNHVLASLADIPAYPHDGGVGGVGDGGSLLYVGFWLSDQTDYIYALSGNQAYPESIPDNRTYRYTMSTNSWERLADLPFRVGYYVGNRLGYADGQIFAWQGAPGTWVGGGDDLAKYVFQSEIYDLSVSVWLSNDRVYFGQNATMRVIITNEGTANAYGSLVNISLDGVVNVNFTFAGTIEPGKSLYRVFEIATTGLWFLEPIMPGNYTICAEVYPFEGEVDVEDNVYILSFTVLPDCHAPLIGVPMQGPPPNSVQPFQNVTLWVNVTDCESGVKDVTLYYGINNEELVVRSMQLNTITGLYETLIEGCDVGTKVRYMIVAYDHAGNEAQQDNSGEYYIYTVIPEFPPAIILSLFMLTTLAATLLLKKKRKTNDTACRKGD